MYQNAGVGQGLRFQSIFENAFYAIVGVDAAGQVIEWNREAERMFGYARAEALGQKLSVVVGSDEVMAYYPDAYDSLEQHRAEITVADLHGRHFPVEITVTQILQAGAREHYVFFHDISVRKSSEQRLLELASTDPLTGLANRAAFNSRLPEAMARSRRSLENMGLMYLDIDHFKSINDHLGHEAGDQLLKEFSELLRASLRQTDFIARLGGDEFVVILEGIGLYDNAIKLSNSLLQAVRSNRWLNDDNKKITPSIGLALFSGGELEPKALIALADKAMYKAKHAGRNTFKILSDESLEAEPSVIPADGVSVAREMLGIGQHHGGDFLQRTLGSIRRHLDMDVAFISRFHDGVREFEVIDAKHEQTPIQVGDSGPLEESYCQRVVDGRLPELIADAFENAEALTLPVTVALPVRAHMSVPIRLSNGDVYGTFCCFSYSADQSLNTRDISMMHVFAELVSDHLEKQPR